MTSQTSLQMSISVTMMIPLLILPEVTGVDHSQALMQMET